MSTDLHYQDATPLLSDPPALRRQMADDGYLYFRRLLPRDSLMDLRRQILEICLRYGWIEGGSKLMDGLVAPAAHEMVPDCGVGVTRPAYQDIYRLEDFHRLAHHPAILSLMESLAGEPIMAHPRHIARMMFPTAANAPTPPHQDHIFIQGTKTAYTCWMPAGDFPETLGGLTVFPGSHKLGLLPVRAALGAGGRSVILDGVEQSWVHGDFEAGDALVFHSLTVHKAIPNQYADRLRLSIDYRYQPVSMPIEEKSLRTHCDMMEWDEVYAGWPTDELKYYWRKYEFEYQEFDWSLLEIRPG